MPIGRDQAQEVVETLQPLDVLVRGLGQRVELDFAEALETGEHPVQHQGVEMRVEPERRVVALHADHGTGAAA